MTFADTFSYFVTLIAIAIAPGPLLLLLMTRAASNDVKGAFGFAFGTALGSLTIMTAVCFGMSVWLSNTPEVLSYSKYIMLAYILWIARDIWKGGFDFDTTVKPRRSGLWLAVTAGFVTCILSPYMLVLFPLVLPEVLDITEIQMPGYLIIAFATFAAEATAAVLVICLAKQVTRLVRSQQSMMIMNRSLATLLVAGGGWMALA
ncbi:LysE family translocator [uncultured Litoreibacter sp.]|uniref:LysE family translocator n=1 Tax=uncultured Litoreibacter sp. TaxID=1392394 RepID=UPI00262F646A|nr:LysE family translocator [uncultured Litoreibacter sp.]